MRFLSVILCLLALLPRAVAGAPATVTAVCEGGGGAPGQELTVTVALTNDAPLSALQLEIAGLGALGEIVECSAAGTGRASEHSAAAGTRPDGSATLMLYSTAMTPIAAGSGDVTSFRIRLGERPADASLRVSAKCADAEGNPVEAAAGSLPIRVVAPLAEYPSGPAYDFGQVPIRGTYRQGVAVRNAGTAPLVVSEALFTDPTFSAEGLPITIAPGATAEVSVVYNPVTRGAKSCAMTLVGNSVGSDNTLRMLAQPFAVNELKVGDAHGVSDSEVVIALSMNNMDAVSGFTTEFELPRQLEYVEGSFALSLRKVDHAASVAVDGGRLRVTAYSLTDTPFRGNDGAIASFRVRLAGRYSASITPSKAVLAAMVDGVVTNVTSAVYPGMVTISYPSVSVAGELSMGRTPVTEVASAELRVGNYGTAPLVIERLTHDGIDIQCAAELPLTIAPGNTESVRLTRDSDVEGAFGGLLGLYTNDPDNRMTHIALDGIRYAPNELVVQPEELYNKNGRCALLIGLDNYDAISAMQFDLVYPEGLTAAEPETQGRAAGFAIDTRRVGERTVRYFLYSLSGAEMAPGVGDVARIPFTFVEGEAEGTRHFTISGVKLSNPAMVDRHSKLSDYTASLIISSATSVAGVSADADSEQVEYYTLTGARVDPSALMPGVYARRTPAGSRIVIIK